MGWLFVFIAAILELVGVIGLNKYNEEKMFTIPCYSLVVLVQLLYFFIYHLIFYK